MSLLLIVVGLTCAGLTQDRSRRLGQLGALTALLLGARALLTDPEGAQLPWVDGLTLHLQLDAVSGFVALCAGGFLLTAQRPSAGPALPLFLLSACAGPFGAGLSWLLLTLSLTYTAGPSASSTRPLRFAQAAGGVAVIGGLLVLADAQGWLLYDGFADHDLVLGAAVAPALVTGALLHLAATASSSRALPWATLAAPLLIAKACPDAPQAAMMGVGVAAIAGGLAARRGCPAPVGLAGVALASLAVAAALAHAEPAALLLGGALLLTLGANSKDGASRLALLSLGGVPLGALEIARRLSFEALRSRELGAAVPLTLLAVACVALGLGGAWRQAKRPRSPMKTAALALSLLALPLAYNALRVQFGQHPKGLLELWLKPNSLSLIALLLTAGGASLGWRRSR